MAGFTKRTTMPINNPFYISSSSANACGTVGYSTCVLCGDYDLNVLPNCVGYACGRFNEIIGQMKYPSFNCNAKNFVQRARSVYPELKVSIIPTLGGIMVWNSSDYGHVAVVEEVASDYSYCIISESNYGHARGTDLFWRTKKITKASNWSCYTGYTFIGCIVNPAVANGDIVELADGAAYMTGTTSYGGAYTSDYFDGFVWPNLSKEYDTTKYVTKYHTITTTLTRDTRKTTSENLAESKSTNLLSYPSLVESPFIIIKVGDYTFGSCSKKGDIERLNSKFKIDFPNYMESIDITKVNGTVNQYTIQMNYQIEAGQDPNMLDKIFSTVGYGTIKISYGDWMSPEFVYKEEEAIISNIKSTIDFGSSSINYIISCTSNSLSLLGGMFDFPARNDKPSNIIKELLNSNYYGLKDIFYGMKNSLLVSSKGLIASDDQVVSIPSKESTDILSYINYLVTYMASNEDEKGATIKTATYYMTIHDDTYGDLDLGGPYFKITKVRVTNNMKALSAANTYEVDVGFPSDNLVTSFNIVDNNSWALLYKYSGDISKQNYTYKIDNNGNMVQSYSPNLTTSSTKFTTTEAQKTWWTNMTQFPISATLEIKGLVRPATLMTYVRINSFFYGQRHVSSGLYLITKQEDKVDSSGYRTILTLTRIGGDSDWYEENTQTVTYKTPYLAKI